MVRPSWAPSAARAIPKSATLTVPVAEAMSTLAGLTSRWMIPWAWAAARAAATAAAIVVARSGSIGPSLRMTSRSVGPSTYSMTMKYCPSSSPKSWTPTMLWWLRPAAALASRRKRSTNEASWARSGMRTLMATVRSSSSSWPR